MHMRTTIILDEALVDQARKATGIGEKAALVRAGLKALIERAAAHRLSLLGGSQPKLRSVPRRRRRA
jgi:Arc/MetJ family transcription regulator